MTQKSRFSGETEGQSQISFTKISRLRAMFAPTIHFSMVCLISVMMGRQQKEEGRKLSFRGHPFLLATLAFQASHSSIGTTTLVREPDMGRDPSSRKAIADASGAILKNCIWCSAQEFLVAVFWAAVRSVHLM